MTGAANRATRPRRGPRWARSGRDSYRAPRLPHGTGGDGCQTAGIPPLTASHAVPVRACGDRGARHRRVRGVTQRTRREPDGLEWESRNGTHMYLHCRLTMKFVLFTCEQWRPGRADEVCAQRETARATALRAGWRARWLSAKSRDLPEELGAVGFPAVR